MLQASVACLCGAIQRVAAPFPSNCGTLRIISSANHAGGIHEKHRCRFGACFAHGSRIYRRAAGLGLSDHTEARAEGQSRPQADAGQQQAIHAGANRRRIQSSGLVSRRASADAADRRSWRQAGSPRLRTLPPADRQRPSGVVRRRRTAGGLHHAADGRVQERRPQGRRANISPRSSPAYGPR